MSPLGKRQREPGIARLQAVGGCQAIATWSEVLERCFDGLIALTDVTGTQPSEQKAADIVVHYVPTAGGVVFGGYAICGDHGCPTSWSAPTCRPAWTATPTTPSAWAR